MPWSTEDITRLIDIESQLQDVDPRLARVVAQQESWLNPNAVGDKGARAAYSSYTKRRPSMPGLIRRGARRSPSIFREG